jgi:hypothetical protein
MLTDRVDVPVPEKVVVGLERGPRLPHKRAQGPRKFFGLLDYPPAVQFRVNDGEKVRRR